MVDRVFQKDPTARQIPLSHRSHIIGFQPLANGTAAHESTLERDFVTLTSFADPTAIIVSQPITLHFEDGVSSGVHMRSLRRLHLWMRPS
jgi:hypothetical protein